jgi:hypothetical protein
LSDISIHFPPWLGLFFLGYLFWPIVLAGAVAAGVFGIAVRGIPRGIALSIAGLLALDLLLNMAIGLRELINDRQMAAKAEAAHSVLTQSVTVDGLDLPAGADVRWTDASHAHVSGVHLPRPSSLFHLTVDESIEHDGQDGWSVHLAAPQEIDGWPCAVVGVDVTAAGRLIACTLSAEKRWEGWLLPAGTILNLNGYGDTVELVAPGSVLPAPEIGRPIPDTGSFRVNRDGSLHDAYFQSEQPYVIKGVALWNTVTWQYDVATFGKGRTRQPISVEGSLVQDTTIGERSFAANQSVSVRLSDGMVMPK